jgi:hypothetical protein
MTGNRVSGSGACGIDADAARPCTGYSLGRAASLGGSDAPIENGGVFKIGTCRGCSVRPRHRRKSDRFGAAGWGANSAYGSQCSDRRPSSFRTPFGRGQLDSTVVRRRRTHHPVRDPRNRSHRSSQGWSGRRLGLLFDRNRTSHPRRQVHVQSAGHQLDRDRSRIGTFKCDCRATASSSRWCLLRARQRNDKRRRHLGQLSLR